MIAPRQSKVFEDRQNSELASQPKQFVDPMRNDLPPSGGELLFGSPAGCGDEKPVGSVYGGVVQLILPREGRDQPAWFRSALLACLNR